MSSIDFPNESDELFVDVPAEEEKTPQSSLLKLLDLKFLLTLPDTDISSTERSEAKQKVLAQIEKDRMNEYLKWISEQLHWTLDEQINKKLTEENEEELNSLDAKIEDYKQNAGDSEVREGILARANFFFRIGDYQRANKAYEETLEKTIGSSSKIDVVFALIRMALSFERIEDVAKNVERAKSLVSAGGDWERKNLLQVYEGVYLLMSRNFAGAAKLFIDSIATFTCYELMSYEQFIFFTCCLSLLHLDRVSLKQKILQSPEILSTIDQIPNLRSLVFSFHKCNYEQFFESMNAIVPQITRDPYFSRHLHYYLRELRIRAYSQFLASYRSASLSSMAQAFGVSVAFIDSELYRFISAGRIHAKIDQISGVVETARPDQRNVQYNAIIKEGDALLNKVQRLTKLVSF
jgi:26S proteasome regulatory subunit N7